MRTEGTWAVEQTQFGNYLIIATEESKHTFIADISIENSEANAQFICKCVNNHDELVKVLEELRDWLKSDDVRVFGKGLSEQMMMPKTFEKVDKVLKKVQDETT